MIYRWFILLTTILCFCYFFMELWWLFSSGTYISCMHNMHSMTVIRSTWAFYVLYRIHTPCNINNNGTALTTKIYNSGHAVTSDRSKPEWAPYMWCLFSIVMYVPYVILYMLLLQLYIRIWKFYQLLYYISVTRALGLIQVEWRDGGYSWATAKVL